MKSEIDCLEIDLMIHTLSFCSFYLFFVGVVVKCKIEFKKQKFKLI